MSFDFYRVNLPDGSFRTFTSFSKFSAFCDYLQKRKNLISYLNSFVLKPSRISVSISEILGVSSSPVLYFGK